jgi:hypothetical protein
VLAGKRLYRIPLFFSIALALWIGWSLLGPSGRQPDAQAASCWQAKITDQQTNLSLAGSVLRVSVQGKAGLPVTVRSMGSFESIGFTGTKPEYGPFVAEFAPLSKGIYFIEPQGLGLTFEVWLTGKDYTRVDFTPFSCAPTATPTPRPPAATATRPAAATTTSTKPTAAATPAPIQPAAWKGRVAERLVEQTGNYWATIVVRVIGRPAGQEVEIRSDNWSTTCKTGTKPEYGPEACEFGALHAGTYRLTPRDLGTYLDVPVALSDFVLVEFYYTGTGETTTRWVGSVSKNTSGNLPTQYVDSAIAVVVAGKPWHEVEIQSGNWSTTCQTGTKPDYGPDACEFAGLRAATYVITPKDLGASVQVTVDGWGWALVRFDAVNVPAPKPTSRPTPAAQPTRSATPGPTATLTPGPTPSGAAPRWKGWIVSNSSGQQPGAGIWSVVVVRVLNHGGVPVTITGGGGWSATCITGTKPEFGPDACEFGGLWPGVYHLRPEGSDVDVQVEMDGLGTAFVEFSAP